jgi:hypothetical protein
MGKLQKLWKVLTEETEELPSSEIFPDTSTTLHGVTFPKTAIYIPKLSAGSLLLSLLRQRFHPPSAGHA